jgi:hypothetical protein
MIIYFCDSLGLQKYQNAIPPEIEIVEQDQHAFFLHGSFPAIALRASIASEELNESPVAADAVNSSVGAFPLGSCNTTCYRWS